MCDVLLGVPGYVTGSGSKLAKNSVTYFMDGSKSPLYKFYLNCSLRFLSGGLSELVFERSPFCHNMLHSGVTRVKGQPGQLTNKQPSRLRGHPFMTSTQKSRF